MKKVEEKKYVVDSGETVSIRVRIFLSKSLSGSQELQDAMTIFLPGWSMSVDDVAVEILCREFCVYTKEPTLAIETHVNNSPTGNSTNDVLHEEAEAILLYIKERGIRKVRIVGHSRGGDKAIHLVSILQNDKSIKIEGLVLLDAVGLYSQKPRTLMLGFAKDTLSSIAQAFFRRSKVSPKTRKIGLRFATDMLWSFVHDVHKTGIAYPARFAREIAEMTQQNPHMKEITVPVVLVSGAEDIISNIAQFSGKYGKTLFPNSKKVAFFTPEKFGRHGLPFYRPTFVARTATKALSRLNKN